MLYPAIAKESCHTKTTFSRGFHFVRKIFEFHLFSLKLINDGFVGQYSPEDLNVDLMQVLGYSKDYKSYRSQIVATVQAVDSY